MVAPQHNSAALSSLSFEAAVNCTEPVGILEALHMYGQGWGGVFGTNFLTFAL